MPITLTLTNITRVKQFFKKKRKEKRKTDLLNGGREVKKGKRKVPKFMFIHLYLQPFGFRET